MTFLVSEWTADGHPRGADVPGRAGQRLFTTLSTGTVQALATAKLLPKNEQHVDNDSTARSRRNRLIAGPVTPSLTVTRPAHTSAGRPRQRQPGPIPPATAGRG